MINLPKISLVTKIFDFFPILLYNLFKRGSENKMNFYNNLSVTCRDDYSFIFNSLKYREFIITHKESYIEIKGYKTLTNKKIIHKNRIGNIITNLLNQSNLIIELLQKYKVIINDLDINKNKDNTSSYLPAVFTIFSLLYNDLQKISPSTFIISKAINKSLWEFLKLKKFSNSISEVQSMSYIEQCNIIIKNQILSLKHLKCNVEKIYSRTSTNKKGYVKYENPIIHTPTCTILYKKQANRSFPYLYKYEISNLEELFNISVYCLSLTKYKIYRCNICNRYFTSNKIKKTCSNTCLKKAEKLREEKNRIKKRTKNSEPVNQLYNRITSFYNRTLKNNRKKQSIRNEMRKKFENNYNKKIVTLNTRYSSSYCQGYQNELLKFLEKEYNKIQKTFPNKKYGNINHSKK